LEKSKPEEQEKQRKIESLKKIRKFMTIIIGSFLQRTPGSIPAPKESPRGKNSGGLKKL
jgi:hypothetical protein